MAPDTAPDTEADTTSNGEPQLSSNKRADHSAAHNGAHGQPFAPGRLVPTAHAQLVCRPRSIRWQYLPMRMQRWLLPCGGDDGHTR